MGLLDRLFATAHTRSPWIYCANAGSYNGCDIEIAASLTPRYDAEQGGAAAGQGSQGAGVTGWQGDLAASTPWVREGRASRYNLPFLAAVIALAAQAHSFSLAAVTALPFGPAHMVAAQAFLLALPARLKSNPFSIANAEQEILAGA